MKDPQPELPQSTQLVHTPVAPPAPTTVDVGMMLKAVIDRGVSATDVAVVEKLADLLEKQELRAAERAFNAAFVALQNDMPPVQAQQAVPNRDGTIRYMFAPYDQIMDKVRPYLQKHGFAINFNTRREEGGRIVAICTLRHSGGHSVSNEFAVRIGSGPPGSSEAQGDGAAATYAKRFALCQSLNIVIERGMDNDANVLGGRIDPAKAAELKQRLLATGADVAAFLKFAGAATFEDIDSAKVPMLESAIRKKESTR